MRARRAAAAPGWACYHTDLASSKRVRFGIIGCAVGASFAVLLAEQLFASGCRFLVSVTSAGQIVSRGSPPYFVVIDRALRDEGTSYHYLPPSEFAEADPGLSLTRCGAGAPGADLPGRGWTTDAPFRETAAAIEAAASKKSWRSRWRRRRFMRSPGRADKPVLCLAHVTNQMAVDGGEFEKGEADGVSASLDGHRRCGTGVARGWGGRAAMRSARAG